MSCACCGESLVPRTVDPWEGRLDAYCDHCASSRCDAYPGECPPKGELDVVESSLTISHPMEFTSERSVWTIKDGKYKRDSLVDQTTPSIDGSLEYDQWIEYRAIFLHLDALGMRLRIVPSERPEGYQGIKTGVLVSIRSLTDDPGAVTTCIPAVGPQKAF